MKTFYVYIMSSHNRTLYTGVTNDLERRVAEHKAAVRGFCAQYNVRRLVWYQSFANVNEAIAGEKRVKGWTRAKKVALIEEINPKWDDLAQSETETTVTLRYSEGAPASEPRDPSEYLRMTTRENDAHESA